MLEDINITANIKNTLQNALKASRLSHAIILEGSDEKTREATAQAIAMHILCKDTNKPCGVCSSCNKVKNASHPDLHIIIKDEKSSMIKVDSIRNIKAMATVLPNDGDKSVFIIKEAQLMNVQSQNALLKIFEEPSPHVSFILTCPSKASLLETIISRATSYSLGEEISSLSDEKSLQAKDLAKELLRCFVSESELDFIRKTAVFKKDKSLFLLTLKASLQIIRDALILASGGRVLISDAEETAKMLKNTLTQKKLLELFSETGNLIENTENAANHNLSITRLSAVFYSIKQKG